MASVALLPLLMSACGPILRSLTEDSRAAAVRDAAGKKLQCAEPLRLEERDSFHDMQWLVSGCGRTAACGEFGTVRCFENPPRLLDFGDERLPNGFIIVAEVVGELTGCPQHDVRIARVGLAGETGIVSASVCDREFSCDVTRIDGHFTTAACAEVSVEQTALKIAMAQLELETGCSTAKIRVAGASLVRGTERKFRFSACEKGYVCTTASGRAECKAALGDFVPEEPAPSVATGKSSEQPRVQPDPPAAALSERAGPVECPAERAPTWSTASAEQKRSMLRRCQAAKSPAGP
jgi:hypothetical protein